MNYKITKDYIGYAVSCEDTKTNIETVKLGFKTEQEAQKYIDNQNRNIVWSFTL